MNSDFTNREAEIVPQELIGSVPREVRLSGDGITLWIVVALLLAWIPIFTIWICFQMQNRTALRRDGRVVIGEVTDKYTPVRGSASIRYTFVVDGVTYSGKSNLPFNLRDRFQESGSIPVRFLPGNPSINHPDAWEWSADLYFGAYFYMFIAAISSILLMTKPLRERKLAREGVIGVAEISRCIFLRRSNTFELKYNLKTEDGRSFIGSGVSNSPQQIGANILVLYLHKNPRRNSLYPLRNYLVAGG